MEEAVNVPVDQQPVSTVDRRRWNAPRSPLASSVSPALRAAVRKLDETRTEFVAATSGQRPPQPGE